MIGIPADKMAAGLPHGDEKHAEAAAEGVQMYNIRRQRACVDNFLHAWTRLKFRFIGAMRSIKRHLMGSIPRLTDAFFSPTNSSFSQS